MLITSDNLIERIKGADITIIEREFGSQCS
jgi:hypothetical protein